MTLAEGAADVLALFDTLTQPADRLQPPAGERADAARRTAPPGRGFAPKLAEIGL
jgi:hypothetical protein